MSQFDVVIIGSGINSLVCGAVLAKRGRKVCILEREPVLGGCIRTDELTLPGFRHDSLSTLYPLFVSSPHFPLLESELARYGATFVNSPCPTGVLRSDGGSLILQRSRERNGAELERLCAGEGDAYRAAMRDVETFAPLTFGMLGGEPFSGRSLRLLLQQFRKGGAAGLCGYFSDALLDARSWLQETFRSDVIRALFAPWVLHVGLGPESATSALMAKLVLFTLEAAGAPMVAGGSANLVSAFEKLIRGHGGEFYPCTDADRVVQRGKSAQGVLAADGREFMARDAVVCNVTPTQLYGRLLRGAELAPDIRGNAARFRYGRGEMQIHLALSEPPRWTDERLGRVAMLHVTDGLDGVSRAVNEAVRGLLPARATLAVAQPTALDPSRAPPGRSILWIQLLELPRRIAGDAAGEISCPADGSWTAEVRERYADRIIDRLSAHIPNLESSLIGRSVLSPADLERTNINLVGGDPYSGSCELSQFMMFRPLTKAHGHGTAIRKLFHIGAATHPGPGLGGMSGWMVSQAL